MTPDPRHTADAAPSRPVPDVDLHTHHVRCGHALGDLEDYVRHAVEIGIRILGISDHAPLFAHEDDHPAPRIQMARSEFPRYLEEARRLQRTYAGAIQVLVGVEADYVPGSEDVYRDALAREELDFVIGSVHAFGPHHVYQRETWEQGTDRAELFGSYFRHVQGAARSGMFDVLAHFDAIKVFGPDVFEVAPRELEQTIDAIAESGITVEINTAGLRKCGEVFPRPSLIGELARRGVPFTFGSDAHAPGELLHGGSHVLELCAAHGVDAFHYFVRRRRHRHALARPA